MALNVTISINSYKYPMHICVLWTMDDWYEMAWHRITKKKKLQQTVHIQIKGVCLFFGLNYLFPTFFSSCCHFAHFFARSRSLRFSFFFFSSESLHVCFSKHFYDFSLKENICTKQRKELSKYSIWYGIELFKSSTSLHFWHCWEIYVSGPLCRSCKLIKKKAMGLKTEKERDQ